MSFQDLLNEGRLEQRPTSRQEILDLLNTADRGMADAAVEQVSLEGRFNHAYDAALIFATVSLRCAGYRTRGEGHHQLVFALLPDVMGRAVGSTARYFQQCRKIRNLSTYSRSGIVSRAEVIELIAEAARFGEAVRRWVGENYPENC